MSIECAGVPDEIEVDVPAGWLVIDPPPGIALLAVEPDESRPFRSNLVVTTQPRDSGGAPDPDEIDNYLETLLEILDDRLHDVEVLAVWVAGPHPDAPERHATQRVLLGHRVDVDGIDGPADAEMMQQHIWLDDTIVTVTATIAADADQRMVDTLNVCLESLAVVA